MNTVFDRKKGYYSAKGFEENKTEFEYNVDLPLSTKASIIKDTIDLIIEDEGTNKRYHSILKDTMFKFMVITSMTDIDTSFVNEETSRINAIDYFVNENNIFEIIVANTGVLIPTLYKALNDEIASITGVREDISNAVSSLVALINTALKQFTNLDVESISKAAEKISLVEGEVNQESLVNALISAKDTVAENNE